MTARWLPRLVAARAWISSTITASTPRSVSRAADVSMRYSDSGVVIRMSGGWRTRLRRSSAGVSPVRMPTVGSVYASPSRSAASRMPWSGLRRFFSTSTASARSGDTYTMRVRCVRSAGAGVAGEAGRCPRGRPTASCPSRWAPGSACARRRRWPASPAPARRVASGNEVLNHARTAGENSSSGSGAATDQGYRRPLTRSVRDRAAHGGLRSCHGERAHHVRVDVADVLVGARAQVDVELLPRRPLLEVGGRRAGRGRAGGRCGSAPRPGCRPRS